MDQPGPEAVGSAVSLAARTAGSIDWSRYLPNLMFLDRRPFATSFTSVGCPRNCAFCSVPLYEMTAAHRSPEEIVGEMTFLDRCLGVRTVNFVDDETLFTSPLPTADLLLSTLIRQRLGLRWSIYLSRFDVDGERLRAMRRAGCWRIYVLAESGVEGHLQRIKGRPVSLQSVAEQVQRIHEAGIEVGARFQYGLPGESFEEGLTTLRFALSLPLDLASFVRPLFSPGSAMSQDRSPGSGADLQTQSYYSRSFPPDSMSLEEQNTLLSQSVRRFYGRSQGWRLLTGSPSRTWNLLRRVVLDGID